MAYQSAHMKALTGQGLHSPSHLSGMEKDRNEALRGIEAWHGPGALHETEALHGNESIWSQLTRKESDTTSPT